MHEQKVKSLAVAEIFRYCKGFRLSYSYFCVLDQKYKRGLLRDTFTKLSESSEKRTLKEVSVLLADGDWIESKDQATDGIRLIQTGNVGFGVYLDKCTASYHHCNRFHYAYKRHHINC